MGFCSPLPKEAHKNLAIGGLVSGFTVIASAEPF
jgi:hypothetical protein